MVAAGHRGSKPQQTGPPETVQGPNQRGIV